MSQFESKKLREERAEIIAQMNELAADVNKREDKTFQPEELEKYDRMDADQKSLLERAESIERIEKLSELKIDTPATRNITRRGGVVTRRDTENALRAWALRAAGRDDLVKDEYREAAEKCGLNINGTSFTVKLSNEQRAQTLTDAQGGHTVNDSVVQGLEESLLSFGGMRGVSRVVRTATGSPIHWATMDDTSNKGAIVAENTTVSNTSITFGRVTLDAYKYASGVYPVSIELMQDSEINLSSLISEALGTRLARIHNEHFTVADGSSKPRGVVTASTKGADATATSAVTYDELVDLLHSVDAAYRNGGRWMMNDATLAEFKKMVDANDRPLWVPGLASREPDSLLGYPVTINNDMADLGAAEKPILFGNFDKYVIRDVSEINVRVLNERFIDDGSIGFIAFSRNDGDLLNSAAVKHILMAAS